MPRTRSSHVVARLPAVPAGAATTHLRNPRPHLLGRCVNGDRVRGAEDGVANQRVYRKRTAFFGNGGDAGSERHTAVERAFAVPEPSTQKGWTLRSTLGGDLSREKVSPRVVNSSRSAGAEALALLNLDQLDVEDEHP